MSFTESRQVLTTGPLPALYLSLPILTSVPCAAPAHPPPPAALCSLTWQDDIRETQFACECQGPVEHRLVLPPDLFQLTSQQLQGNDESWGVGGGVRGAGDKERRRV